MPTTHDEAKRQVRTRVWDALDAASATYNDTAHGRIPHFRGADRAAARLADLPAWQAATTIKSVPDKAQLPVRARALADGKTVYMAVPRLATPRPFYLLDPAALAVPPLEAATSRVAATVAPTVDVDGLRSIQLVVLGSVAVDRGGTRIGKGAGYSDLEFALLTEAGLITPETLVVTTVHPLQVIDEPIPATEHDVGVDLIVTPDAVITCPTPHRPAGILWEHLDVRKIAEIPALERRYTERR
ncbi:5-formyltetrahydrofolate cyclo-ligase [Streptomyces sp. AV19]|uniref:5-formyltetrahydrofolate cyclo-ligase n=1 Tax=Streptomyces sp. AV19 TaxID=2793068 RepID=UPI0018FEDA3B|nr:5-formyltetrahydrofolate cyclo-ligase [Streptomyces sp. AV19]MBH1933531.1 5-formyltetrahydrofolate cyclo-ligase [Streptomyces sp. AV19]MDG4532185.1 5-formyltetrahydrofolate cyclo-ligase [Streptomyces sp. AV19]